VADKGCAQFGFWIDPFVKKESKNSYSPPLQVLTAICRRR
jgi:hypothetical protein